MTWRSASPTAHETEAGAERSGVAEPESPEAALLASEARSELRVALARR